MSPRKTILRELARAEAGSGSPYVRPSSLPGFAQEPEKYQKAVNELLSDRLLEGRKDDEGHMAIAINQHRRKDVEKEIKPVWANPILWIVFLLVAAAGGVAATL
mgnify:CR=1 FL=1